MTSLLFARFGEGSADMSKEIPESVVREAIKVWFGGWSDLDHQMRAALAVAVEWARKDEREACAKVCDYFAEVAYSEGLSEDIVMARAYMAKDAAAAIRARGE